MSTGIVPQVERLSSMVYLIPSATEQGKAYRVALDGSQARCECKGYTYRQECHHIFDAWDIQDEEGLSIAEDLSAIAEYLMDEEDRIAHIATWQASEYVPDVVRIER